MRNSGGRMTSNRDLIISITAAVDAVGKLKGASMRNKILSFFAFLLCSIASPHTTQAADAGAVLGACDRTAGCNYTQNKAGDISGCSSQACFYCPADGKRQCFGVAARTGKGTGRGVPVNVGGVKIEPLPGKRSVGTGTVKTGGVKQTTLQKTDNKQTNQDRSGSGGGGKRH